ncbi:MAG: ABC transporter permease, partial [Paracoccaceae bacterium]
VFDFVLASLLLLGLLVFMGMPISWNIILFPLYGAWALVLGLSIGLLLAALNCIYKEIYQSIGYVLQVGFFFSPVLYPASSVPDKYLQYYQMNPMVGVIDGFRWCFIQQGSPPNMSDVVGMTLTLLMFVAALHVFRKIEPLMSDLK